MSATTVLGPGESVASDLMKITMRTDGNLVITDENGTVRWSSHTEGTGHKAVFQDDGHFVVYPEANGTAGSSGTAGNPGAQLVIQADGKVVIESAGGAVLWSPVRSTDPGAGGHSTPSGLPRPRPARQVTA